MTRSDAGRLRSGRPWDQIAPCTIDVRSTDARWIGREAYTVRFDRTTYAHVVAGAYVAPMIARQMPMVSSCNLGICRPIEKITSSGLLWNENLVPSAVQIASSGFQHVSYGVTDCRSTEKGQKQVSICCVIWKPWMIRVYIFELVYLEVAGPNFPNEIPVVNALSAQIPLGHTFSAQIPAGNAVSDQITVVFRRRRRRL